MSYTVLNADVFTAAFSGATSGMGVSGRVITDGDPNRYSGLNHLANAFAQEFDTLWGVTAVGFLEIETIFLATEAMWQERAPVVNQNTLNPAHWQVECEAIIALVHESLNFYAANGYPDPSIGHGGTIVNPLPNVRYVDGDYTGGGSDGSIAKPWTTIQDAFDDVTATSGTCTLVVTPSVTSPGDLLTGTFNGSLNIRGENSNQQSLETPVESTSFGFGASMGNIACPAGVLNLRVTCENIAINAINATTEGPPASNVRVMLTKCQCFNINIPIGRLFSLDSSVQTIIATDVFAYQTEVNATAPSITATNINIDLLTYNRLVAVGAVLTGTLTVGDPYPTPTTANKHMVASVTVADGDLACATAVAATPAKAFATTGGYIAVVLDTVLIQVGDGTKVGVPCYFSGDGGVTARSLKNVVAGDTLRWNGTVAGFQLAASDRIDFLYGVTQ